MALRVPLFKALLSLIGRVPETDVAVRATTGVGTCAGGPLRFLLGTLDAPARLAGPVTLLVKAALLVLRSKRPLATLRDVAGNLPSLARPLSRVSLEGKHEEARRALEEPRRSQRLQSAQHGALTLNGLSAG